MRIDNSVQNFYRNVLNKKRGGVPTNQGFESAISSASPCTLTVEKVDKPVDIEAEGAKAATESMGTRARMNTFTDEWQKLFGTNIDDKKKLNMDALGDSKLTDEQIKDLQKRYDVENLTPQDKYNLMTELTDLGAISGTDAINSTLSMVAMPIVNGVPMMTKEGNGILSSSMDFLSNLQNTATQEMEAYDYMNDTFEKTFDDVKNIAESHQRLLDVLVQLKRKQK